MKPLLLAECSRPGGRAYGAMMDIAPKEATCYNLPGAKFTGTNKDYAKSLLQVASRLGLPDAYLDEIRQDLDENSRSAPIVI